MILVRQVALEWNTLLPSLEVIYMEMKAFVEPQFVTQYQEV